MNIRHIIKLNLILISSVMFFTQAYAQNYPEISVLKSKDILFSQFQEEVEKANKDLARQKQPWLNFYCYRGNKDDFGTKDVTVFDVASRCSLRWDTILTANGIENAEDSVQGRLIVIPTVNGLFIPCEPQNKLEMLLRKEYEIQINSNLYPKYYLNGRQFYFIQTGLFSPADRAYALDKGMVLPLSKYVLTSDFGMRISPISGKWKMHNGIDMAAPLGTPIYACKAGVVSKIGKLDPTYGNYVLLKHSNGMTSMYAHMSDVLVEEGKAVSSGQTIGKVGLTGQTTGPHLHFEIKLNGSAQDPKGYFN